jgi:hypothetical protein
MTGMMRTMRMGRLARRMTATAAFAVAAGGCRDRAPAKEQAPPPSVESIHRRVEMRLYVARDWAWNEQDTLRVSVVNGTEQPLSGELSLLVGSGMEVMADSSAASAPADSAGRMVVGAEGTRVTFSLGTLAPGATGEFRQAVRTPPAPVGRRPAGARDTVSAFAVRAVVTGADGRELAQAADTIRIRAGSEVVAGGCGGVRDVAVTRYGIGPLRLDMDAGDVRTLCPEARDTTWPGPEGMTERGLAVRLAGHPVTVVLNGQRVARIQVDTAGVRTGTGMGVGNTLAELRGRYGRVCAGQGEGFVAVWFPAAPGISFALDSTAAVTGDVGAADGPAEGARVERMWVRAGTDDCPRGD